MRRSGTSQISATMVKATPEEWVCKVYNCENFVAFGFKQLLVDAVKKIRVSGAKSILTQHCLFAWIIHPDKHPLHPWEGICNSAHPPKFQDATRGESLLNAYIVRVERVFAYVDRKRGFAIEAALWPDVFYWQ